VETNIGGKDEDTLLVETDNGEKRIFPILVETGTA